MRLLESEMEGIMKKYTDTELTKKYGRIPVRLIHTDGTPIEDVLMIESNIRYQLRRDPISGEIFAVPVGIG